MYLLHTSLGRLFMTRPLAALSVLICMVTIVFCFWLRRTRPHHRSERFLIGFLGFIAIFQGLHVLQGAGVVRMEANARFGGAIDLVVAACCLIAALMLKLTTINRMRNVDSALRLARAAPPRPAPPGLESALNDPAALMSLNLQSLHWALALSDSAFKFYVFLCLRAGPSGIWSATSQDARLQTGKSSEDLEAALHELQRAGAIALRRDGSRLEIEIARTDPRRRGTAAPLPEIVA
ncbi:MAG: hypothetical protein ACRD30_00250 [Bryobacteraceae bacterium]